jgi:hypothetical protein
MVAHLGQPHRELSDYGCRLPKRSLGRVGPGILRTTVTIALFCDRVHRLIPWLAQD